MTQMARNLSDDAEGFRVSKRYLGEPEKLAGQIVHFRLA